MSLVQPLVVTDARQPGLDSLANIAAADAEGADLPLLPASSGVKPTAAAASVSVGHGLPPAGFTAVQPPSPTASCRSRAGSVAAEDLAFHWGQGPTLQQAQTLQQAVQAKPHGTSGVAASQAPLQPQGGASDRRQKTAAAARAPAVGGRAGVQTAAAATAAGPHPSTQLPLAFSKTLDYKSCDHILCLTKDMARQLLPPAPHSCASTGPAPRPLLCPATITSGRSPLICCSTLGQLPVVHPPAWLHAVMTMTITSNAHSQHCDARPDRRLAVRAYEASCMVFHRECAPLQAAAARCRSSWRIRTGGCGR